MKCMKRQRKNNNVCSNNVLTRNLRRNRIATHNEGIREVGGFHTPSEINRSEITAIAVSERVFIETVILNFTIDMDEYSNLCIAATSSHGTREYTHVRALSAFDRTQRPDIQLGRSTILSLE